MKARDVLKSPGGNALPFGKWLDLHRAAQEFVNTWIEMRKAGESDWSARRVFLHLRREFGCPSKTESVFQRWLESQHAEFYRKVVAR